MPISVNQLVLGIAVALGLAVVGVSAIGNAAAIPSSLERNHGDPAALSSYESTQSNANAIAAREHLRTVFIDAFNARVR